MGPGGLRFRWSVVAAMLACTGVSWGAAGAGAASASQKPVTVDGGRVQGAVTGDGKVVAYKGIPFAAPPVGPLRWRPPHPVLPWKGVRDAKDFGSHCYQGAVYADMVFHDPGPSEDCLTLNVWTPSQSGPVKPGSKGAGLPVMVWIYGGGFVTGGTSENRQDGEFLAKRGVVVVSMNYRLGVMGFMALPELAAESPQHASGNYGLMDQAAALAWVKRNIAKFGGDPGNVTLFGESAGSFSVTAQMAAPMAKDLIQRAIGESGGALYSAGLGFPLREDAEKADAAWCERAFGASTLATMRAVKADALEAAVTNRDAPVRAPRFGPDVDGYFLPDTVPHLYAAGAQAHIPVLGGWNKNEQRAPANTTSETFRAQAKKLFGDRADEFLAVYPAGTDAEALDSAGDFASDQFIAFSTWEWLEAQTRTGGKPVYRYFFDLPSPGDKNHSVAAGAFHSDDIEYVFGTLDLRPEMKIRPEDRALSEVMQTYWVNFARTGDPNGPGVPQWPSYSPEGHWEAMHLDATPKAEPDQTRGRYLFLDSEWGAAAGK